VAEEINNPKDESAAPAAPSKPAAAVPPPPPKPAAPAAPPKPKGPVPEPWSDPLVDAIKEKFGAELIKAYSFIGQNQIEIGKGRLVEIMTFLRDAGIGQFIYLADETAVHWPKTEEFELVYILYSFEKNQYLRVKARTKEWEAVQSVVTVWGTANWLEREIYDMFGMQVFGHPTCGAFFCCLKTGRISIAQGLRPAFAGCGVGAQAPGYRIRSEVLRR
jgi:NADH-quinone oxidoreductase subunit C